MSAPRDDLEARARDAVLAVTLWCVDPAGLGVLLLRGPPCPGRDTLLTWLPRLLPRGSPVVPLPLGATDDRLLGGVALAETLRAGRIVRERGLLQSAHGGVVVARMAERLEPQVAALLVSALDRGLVDVEREGASAQVHARIGVIALDESRRDDDRQVPRPLVERASFCVDLEALGSMGSHLAEPDAARCHAARAKAALVGVPGVLLESVVATAAAFGIHGVRAALTAIAATRAHAALRGQAVADTEDAEAAVRLVLAWRATRIPGAPPEPSSTEDPPTPELQNDESHDPLEDGHDEQQRQAQPEPIDPAHDGDEPHPRPPCADDAAIAPVTAVEDVLVDAVKSALPAGMLAALDVRVLTGRSPQRTGRSGAERTAPTGGRPAGVRAGAPRHGERLHVVDTIRAAAPWQPVRRRAVQTPHEGDLRRVLVRPGDFRVARRRHRTESCVIFCVDASGSSALQRLTEVKGAIEHVLLDCYARRDHVALIAFRGDSARTILAPTRSLTRVRKDLAALPGGGTTPLAAGIDAGLVLAVEAMRKGQSPILVLMTDGRGNVALDGATGPLAASHAAQERARAVRAAQIPTLFLDTAPRPREPARALALAMGARYMPLPFLDGAGIARAVHALVPTS